ncbi:MAG: hypothetical protein A2171_00425 [Candidatus Levybacteria bacterium RBG_13_35_9]|nr:MAG: hypothetical protein A2171_00425 [Candidatus Levybacteria bacterium RBG_13_35_9]
MATNAPVLPAGVTTPRRINVPSISKEREIAPPRRIDAPLIPDPFPVIPKIVTPEQFAGLDGFMQEAVLLAWLRDGDLTKIANSRPDFNIYRQLSNDETAMSFLTRIMLKKDKPITQESIRDDDVFAQIYMLAYPEDRQSVLDKLERERLRATEEFPESLFAPTETFGNIPPARRYLANLLEEIAIEQTGRDYSRDSFKPKTPQMLKVATFDEKEQRMAVAADLYERRYGGLVGIYYI